MKNLNKIFTVIIASAVMITTLAFKPFKNGKVIMTIAIEVKNYAEWKQQFDKGAAIREKAGIRVLGVCTSVENENQVLVIEEAANAQSAHDFLSLLKSKQKEGEIAKLDVKMYDVAE
jgi:hypothetical protein